MGIIARMKSVSGGRAATVIPVATTTTIPDDSDNIFLTGTATVTSLVANKMTHGRTVRLYQSDSGTTTLTNSPGTTTAGQMDLGGLDSSNLVLGPTDVIRLTLRVDGTWVRTSNPVNN
jgi:hypothetical protein